eukprot:CAMPEP_0116062458 /NCGR_PEP_ID=MMETSP0322-20121206/7772_1 /TAXON_ID=163516 /ORGANISM="Leptocylindrus danicus var. apora, Strain B651" /LENGTH=292 /DNA_ID=CAMNT_0003547771 /DNA_START=181 /DNA_END=1059 /DNA_ORIENTATION=+
MSNKLNIFSSMYEFEAYPSFRLYSQSRNLFHSSAVHLKRNKRSAIVQHEAKMQEIERRKLREDRKAEKENHANRRSKKAVEKGDKFGIDPIEEDDDDDVDDSSNEISLPDDDQIRKKMLRVRDRMTSAFKGIRGGEPNVELFENISINAYGASAPLTALAQVVVASPTRVVISPYDPSVAKDIVNGVRDSGLNFNPQKEDGDVIVPIPKVSQETRTQLSKQVGKMAEEGRQRVRKERRKFQDKVKKIGKLTNCGFSEDELFKASKDIDEITDEIIGLINEEVEKKQESIMKV